MAEDTPETILTSVKKFISIPLDDTTFDSEVFAYIQSASASLNKLGIGKSIPFTTDTTYEDFWSEKDTIETKNLVPAFFGLTVKGLFDTPTTGKQGDTQNEGLKLITFNLSIANNAVPYTTIEEEK